MSVETAEFDQVEADILEFQRHHVRRGRTRWITLGVVGLMLLTGIASLLAAGLMRAVGGALPAALAVGMGLFALATAALLFLYHWFVLPWLATQRILMSREQRASLIGLRAVAISPQGVSWTYPVGQGGVTWSGINRIEVDHSAVYFYFTLANATWVPARAFASSEEFNRFADLAGRYLADARVGPTTP